MPQPYESRLVRTLLVQTAATGLIDAVSYLALGHVFTANMTGNIVFLAFAIAGAPGLSIPRSAVSLAAFLAGAVAGGRLAARRGTEPQARWVATAFGVEAVLLLLSAALVASTGTRAPVLAVYGIILLTALAMGVRNATVRTIALPDLTTTVLTLTLTGLAADSALAGGANPRAARRWASVLSMFVGAGLGALLVRRSLVLPLIVSSVTSSSCAIAVALTLREGHAPTARG
jgi:uncharacterized membrane protein YoaK (UPF0700 family)